MTNVKVKILFFFILFLHVTHLKATVHEDFSKFFCKIITTSRNVKGANYDDLNQTVTYQTFKGKENTILCLWYPKNKEKQITIEKTGWEKIHRVDFIMIGYGQTPTNPEFYYFIPSKKIKENFHLKKMEKYLLSFPIIRHEF